LFFYLLDSIIAAQPAATEKDVYWEKEEGSKNRRWWG